MKRKLFFATMLLLLVLGTSATAISASARIPEGSKHSNPPTALSMLPSAHIDYIKVDFGGPWYMDGIATVRAGQKFRISWGTSAVRWCNKWSLDPQFKGIARGRGEYWTQLFAPNLDAATGLWEYDLICGNGQAPNAVWRILVKVL